MCASPGGSKHKVDQNQMQFESALFSHLLQQKIKGLEVSHSVGRPGALTSVNCNATKMKNEVMKYSCCTSSDETAIWGMINYLNIQYFSLLGAGDVENEIFPLFNQQ